MEKTRQILDKLSKLDLSKYPHQEIIDLIGSIGSIGSIVQKFHENKIILRARPNYNGEHFRNVSELSYKPSQFNKTYQRASTPDNTMFYGSTIHENIQIGELDITRVIGLLEALPIVRDPNFEGEQVITYSRWRVVKDISMVSIIHHTDFARVNSYAKEQRENFEKFMANQPDNMKEKTKLVTDFLASEFAKEITPSDYDYLISAIYTEMATHNGLAGVFYPSVRTAGEGFNVAIHPYFLDNDFLVPEFVGECTIYKRGKHIIVDNESSAIILVGQKDFELKPVEPTYRAGKDQKLRKLYPENY